MALALAAAGAFALGRWLDAAHHRLGVFVVAGSTYVHRARAPRGLPIGTGSGYDGQFYYRLALDPFDLARNAFGIHFDTVSRVERIGYPFLAWVVALGHASAVPRALVVVNVVACGAAGLAGGLLARSAGRHALWGLVFPAYWGYLWTLGRDLTELTAAAFFLLGLAALLRHAPGWSGLAFLGAVLSKETTVLLVVTVGGTLVWDRVRHRRWALERRDLRVAVPLAGFAAWELVAWGATGHLPVLGSGSANLGPPLDGLVHGLSHYATAPASVASVLWWGELAVLVVLGVVAGRTLRCAPAPFPALWVVSVVLALCAAPGIWLGDVGFRSLDAVYLTTWAVLLYRPAPLWPWAAVTGATWCVVAVELVRYV